MQKGATINKETLPEIEAIPLQMHQLFYNLINNALKFGKEGVKPVINVACRSLPAREIMQKTALPAQIPFYEIIIADNGIGFPRQFEEQIFGLFKRLGSRQSSAGSGIGLALCRKVVTNHQGTITASGIENEGAKFIIFLPVRQH
jgi:signal transduction histidine kinase